MENTMGLFENLTRTTANTSTQQFEQALDRAWMQVSSGAFSTWKHAPQFSGAQGGMPRMEQLLPNAGLAVIPGAGHYTFFDNPARFYAILDSYLSTLPREDPS